MNDCITTFTRIEFDTFNPRIEDICIEDIAHALSMMVRANGHFPEFYSVGQHSIQCCKEALARNYVPRVALACLLHDASEAYLSDITRPVKKNMTMYLQIEEQLQNMIYKKYVGYIPIGEEEYLIKNIDDTALYYEFDHFMGIKLQPEQPLFVGQHDFEEQTMKEVEKEFLELFYQLYEV